jgi:hypothetical protein
VVGIGQVGHNCDRPLGSLSVVGDDEVSGMDSLVGGLSDFLELTR